MYVCVCVGGGVKKLFKIRREKKTERSVKRHSRFYPLFESFLEGLIYSTCTLQMHVCKQTEQKAEKNGFSLVTDSTNGPNFYFFSHFQRTKKVMLRIVHMAFICKNLFYSQHIYAKFRYPRKRGDSKNPLGSIYTVFTRTCMLLIGSSVRKPSLFYVRL
jgi:hypothetical protein